jgi:esterase FrsA
MSKVHCSSLSLAPDLELYHAGPPLDLGPLPAVFYFALSGPDSLCLDPYNQFVRFLLDKQVRIFSMTLPAHENGLSPLKALEVWAEEMGKGLDPLGDFLDRAERAVDYAFHESLIEEGRLSAAGLSRGGLVASFFAAREKRIKKLLGFAPVTRLGLAREFSEIKQNTNVQFYDTANLAQDLSDRKIRFYMGNRDMRVSTRACFECVEALVEAAHKERNAQVELILTPSIGHMGHGTSMEIFKQGAEWISSL